MSVNRFVLEIEIGCKDISQNFYFLEKIVRLPLFLGNLSAFSTCRCFWCWNRLQYFFFRFHVRMSQLKVLALFIQFHFLKKTKPCIHRLIIFSKKMDFIAPQEYGSGRISKFLCHVLKIKVSQLKGLTILLLFNRFSIKCLSGYF